MASAFRTVRRSLAVQAGCSGLLALGYFNVRSAVREAEKQSSARFDSLEAKEVHQGPLAPGRPRWPFVLLLDNDQNGGLPDTASTQKVVDAIRHAGTDDQVIGLVTHVGDVEDALQGPRHADIQALRAAVISFRKLKRDAVPTVAYSYGYNTLSYYLASACDQIYLAPGGDLFFTGLSEVTPFMRPLLDHLGVNPPSESCGEFKTAMHTFTEKGYTKHHRAATYGWLSSCIMQIVDDVAEARGLSPHQVAETTDMPPLSSQDAIAAGLIDGVAHKLDAMHLITHTKVVPEGSGQPGLPQQGACMTAAQTESLSSQPTETIPDKASPSEQLELAATAATAACTPSSASRPVHYETPFLLTSSAEKRAVMQELWDAASEETRLALLPAPRLVFDPMHAEFRNVTLNRGTVTWGQEETRHRLLMPVHEYAEIIQREAQAAAKASAAAGTQPKSAVAVVHVEGVQSDAGLIGALGCCKHVARAIRAAATDTQTKAIVLKIDSPGGDIPTTNEIIHEVSMAKSKGIPVIACLGNNAASAGYELAASANKIVTQPGTATGSIGIACLDLNLAPAFKKAGINLDSVSVGRYQSPGTPWFWLVEKTSDDVCWFNAFKDREYKSFVRRVAEGRGMSYEAVHKVAKGRIWTGQQALDRGLVDYFGGLHDAISLAKRLAGLPMVQHACDIAEAAAVDVTNWRDGWEVDGKGPDPAGPAPLQFPSIPALPKAPPTQETVLAIVSQLTSRYGFGKKKPNEDDTIRVPVLRRMAQRNKQQRFEENKQ